MVRSLAGGNPGSGFEFAGTALTSDSQPYHARLLNVTSLTLLARSPTWSLGEPTARPENDSTSKTEAKLWRGIPITKLRRSSVLPSTLSSQTRPCRTRSIFNSPWLATEMDAGQPSVSVDIRSRLHALFYDLSGQDLSTVYAG